MSAKGDPTLPLEKNRQKQQQPESEMRTVIFELFKWKKNGGSRV